MVEVIERDRWVDEEAEQSCSHEIPKCNRDEEVDGPFVIGDPLGLLCRLRKANVFPGFIANQRERHNFKCAEDCSQANDCGRCTGEVQVMEGADDSAGQEDRSREERSLGRGTNFDQLEPREKEANHDSGEHFKEAFNPEMNYPPAPVFSSNEMAALTVHQSG